MTHLRNAVGSLAAAGTDGHTQLTVHTVRREYSDVRWGCGLVTTLGDIVGPLADRLTARSVHVITDRTVAALHLDQVLTALAATRCPVHHIIVPGGETNKSLRTLGSLHRRLHQQHASRRSLIVALGGGVVCDIAAFAAATYMRGIPYLTVPTTLLAQADAALGGKAGADAHGVKNLIGTFHQPTAVVIDPSLLATVSRAQMSNGLAEIVKVALIADHALYQILVQAGPALLNPTDHRLPQIIHRAGRRKLELLAPDPYEERELRRDLNLGHCLGHPLEAASGYTMPHGHAVARGIAWAAMLAADRGLTTLAACQSITRTLATFHLPITIPVPLRDAVWAGLDEIRRIRNGELHLVLPLAPGLCTTVADVDRTELDRAAAALDQWRGRPDHLPTPR